MKRAWNSFLVGILNGMVILLPVAITVLVIKFFVIKVNDYALTPLVGLFPLRGESPLNIIIVKIILFLLLLSAVASIGWIAKILVVNKFFTWWERVLLRIPLLGRIYNVSKEISSAFIGQGKTIFKNVVMVEYPRKGIYSIGFITGNVKGEIKEMIGGSVTVFIPTTPNPTSGVFIILPREDVTLLKMSVEDGMKFIISGGAVIPEMDKFIKIENQKG